MEFILTFAGGQLASDNRISHRSIAEHAGSSACLDRICQLVSDCEVTHLECRVSSNTSLFPRRLLDLEARSGICLRDNFEYTSEKYIALSHCWGPPDPSRLILTTKNEVELKENIDFHRLTTVFKEAIQFTRYLKTRYLWIDALCIIQDSKEDWAAEAARMASVYEHAALTLATASSPDSHTSFLQPRDIPPSVWLPAPAINNRQGEFIMLRECYQYLEIMKDHLTEPLQSRAWCLQERILSRRTIFFDTKQFLFECHHGTFPESWAGTHDLLNYDASGRNMLAYTKIQQVLASDKTYRQAESIEENRMAHWYRLLDEYGRRKLTYRTDLLPAFSGVAKHFMDMTNDTYIAGIWQQDFHAGLLWQFHESQEATTFTRTEFAPTWSWASAWSSQGRLQPSAVIHQHHHRKRSDRDATLIRVELDPLHEDVTSQLQHGVLHISGLSREIQLKLDKRTGIRESHKLQLLDPVCGLEASGWFDGDTDLRDLLLRDDSDQWTLTLTALMLSQWEVHYHSTVAMLHGLLLLPGSNGRHLRRGTFRIDAPMMQGDELVEAQKYLKSPGAPRHFKFNPRRTNFDGTWQGWKLDTFAIE